MNCVNCGKDTNSKSKYCSKKCEANYRARRRGYRLKRKAVAYKGGKCIKCGYDKCIAALQFHHRDPTKKLFELKVNKLRQYSWKKVLKELDKCDLLCANCHAEVEFEEISAEVA